MKSGSEVDDRTVRALRERVDELERLHAARMARANETIAAAQDRSYWLERWGVDLNALMRRRGAPELRAALRVLRSLYRIVRGAGMQLRLVPADARRVRDEARQEALTPDDSLDRRELGPSGLRASPVTDVLYDRLTPEDVGAVQRALDPSEANMLEAADEAERKRLTLAFAAHHSIESALARSGLDSAAPPPDVHSMGRGPIAAGGTAYYADLVVDALRSTGFEPEAGMTGLDFGCSSGRVVRVLAAAFPELEWHGCDPIPEAIDWARDNLPAVRFDRSPEYPPLPYVDGMFDFVFAVSIWSHFSEAAALWWLDEMRRVIRPGGRLLLTAHGNQTIAHSLLTGQRERRQLDEISASLYRSGFWYAAEFGVEGDHGVANPDWGTAFFTPEWLAARLTPRWRIAMFAPGRAESNQDVYVLESS